MATVEQTLDRASAAKDQKSQWLNHWDDLARVMSPRNGGFVTSLQPGDELNSQVFDGTPMFAARDLGNAIGSLVRPEGEKWIFIHVDDEEIDQSEEAQQWLEAAEDEMAAELGDPKSRARQAMGETDHNLAVFGTGFLFIGENQARDNILFQSISLRQGAAMWSEEGVPTDFFIHKPMTVRQAVLKFGMNALSEETRRKANEKTLANSKLRMMRAVTLRDDGRENALLAKNFKWQDQWIEIDAKHRVTNSGFQTFPFITPRWDTSSGEEYGRSPGMIALPDSNTLQAMGETILVSGQRQADPPLMAPNDGSFSEVNAFPGGLSYYDVETASQIGGNPFFPLETGGNLPITRDMQQDFREQVFIAFFRNVLRLPLDGPQMTATEIIARKEEFIRAIGPVFGRIEADYTAPVVERSFDVMLRAGAFPPIPEILSGQKLVFEYESPVKAVRKQIQAAAARQWAEETLILAEADPSAKHVVNVAGLSRFAHNALNLPADVIRSEEEVAAMNEADAEAAAAQAETDQVAEMAEIANTATDAASNVGIGLQ